MTFTLGFIVAGLLLVGVAVAGSALRRLPLSTAMLYVAVGVALGPAGARLLDIDPIRQAALLERLTEVAVIVSLFTAGLKLRLPLQDGRWRMPLRLASVSMVVTIGLVTLVGVTLLNMPLGLAVLLGAVLAPTDPVLASDVQVREPGDRDRLRSSLTGEAGLNDGTAFPFVMLGLGLLGLREIGAGGWRWFAVDGVWAIAVGLAVGAGAGTAVGRFVLYLRREHKEAVGLDDFLALGLIALAYGVALLLRGYGFLAVFAAGLAVRRIEARESGTAEHEPPPAVAPHEAEDAATHREHAPAYLTQAVLAFNEQLERIGELAVMVLLGAALSTAYLTRDALWFVPLLLLGIRPLGVWLGLLGAGVTRNERRLIGWFGIRGIGSIYYLTYAIEQGVPSSDATRLIELVFSVIVVSVLAHGISVTPLMNIYERSGVRARERALRTGAEPS